MRFLVVDDSQTMRAILCTYARNLSVDTVEAGDGVEALERLASSGPFDAILIDWDMPRMNGLELLKKVRGDHAHDSMRTLMVTAQNTYEKVAEAIASGADEFLMKPLDEQMFVEKLCVLGLVN